MLKHSRIGDEFRSKTFDTFSLVDVDERVRKAWTVAKAYADNFETIRSSEKPNLGIVGAVGAGKTHLLCAVANVLISKGIAVRYFNFVTGFKEMFAKYDEGGQAVEDIRWELQTCEVLMMDDLAKGKIDALTGSVKVRSSVFDELYGILDYRYFNRLPILWSSEMYSKLATNDVLGEANATRLIEKSDVANVLYRKNEKHGGMNFRLRELRKKKQQEDEQ